MTAHTAQAASPTRHSSPLAGVRLSFVGTLRSEWIKFFAVRSTGWMLVVTLVTMVGFSAMMAAGMRMAAGAGAGTDASVQMTGDPAMAGLDVGIMSVTFSYGVAQIVIAVLGALAMTGEFSTGRIRSTFAAVPRRGQVLLAKMIVVALTAFVTSVVAVAACFGVVTAILAPVDLAPSLSADGALRSLVGVPLYLTAITLFALAIGTLLRSTPGSIAAVLGIILVLPIVSMIPFDWVQTAAQFLPAAAGERLFTGGLMDATLGPWQGFGVLCAWVVVLMAAGAMTLRRRDA
ncbi:ABC transporter permease subunit [Pseudactinotalea sp. HY158]|uniref:ABC transporter permease subunit n=1 Tax=Pseudactinotalea sp. HY158 TaxID=2654547 RepID=UPI00129CB433|nr:ABC transporter permease subunit [Pseudactinotalea sp. HY158]QGH68709.1 ABC transporter permease subunit [Pseudactinotalea sp. HY158]